MTTNEVFNCLL